MLSGYVSLAAILLAPLLAWSAMQGKATWRRYRGPTLATAALLLAAALWLAACHFSGQPRDECPVGLAQRLLICVLDLWIVSLSIGLWQGD